MSVPPDSLFVKRISFQENNNLTPLEMKEEAMTQQLFLMSDVSRMLGVPADNILDGGPAGQIEAIPESIRMERAGEPSLIGAFSVHRSGHVGQEILNQDGKIIAWTTDEWTAQVICKLLNEHQELI